MIDMKVVVAAVAMAVGAGCDMEPTYPASDAARDICGGKAVDVSYSFLNYWVSRPGHVGAGAIGEVPLEDVMAARRVTRQAYDDWNLRLGELWDSLPVGQDVVRVTRSLSLPTWRPSGRGGDVSFGEVLKCG